MYLTRNIGGCIRKFKIGDKVKHIINPTTIYEVDHSYEDDGYVFYMCKNEYGYVPVIERNLVMSSEAKVLEITEEETTEDIPKKYNTGKPRTDLISGEFILGLGKALEYGASKYDENKQDTPNYLKGDGFLYSELIGALERHFQTFKSGVDIDEESGLEHILQVAVNAMFLYNYRISGKGIDNRIKLGKKDNE